MPIRIVNTREEYERALIMREERKDDPIPLRMALIVIWFYNHPMSNAAEAAEIFGVARGVLFKDLHAFRNPQLEPKKRRKRRLSR
jgi:hypothetical protein